MFKVALRWLAAIGAAVLIVLALLVGVARLLLPLAPDYREDIRRFASEATGFDIRFARMNATWPLAGPEVRFYDVTVVAPDNGAKVLQVAELGVGVSMVGLLAERRVLPGRVSVEGARIVAERRGAAIFVNGIPLEQLLRRRNPREIPRLDLQLSAIDLLLREPGRLVPAIDLRLERLSLALGRDRIGFEGEVRPRGDLGRSIEVAGAFPAALLPNQTGSIDDDAEWSIDVDGRGLDVSAWLRIALNQAGPVASGRADVSAAASFRGRQPIATRLDLQIRNLMLAGLPPSEAGYRRLEVEAAWQRSGQSWRAELERFAVERVGQPRRETTAKASFTPGTDADAGLRGSLSAVQLADLYPLVRAVASRSMRAEHLPQRLLGEIRELEFQRTVGTGDSAGFRATAALRELGVVMPRPGIGVIGISGRLQMAESGGRFELNAGRSVFRFPDLFRRDLELLSSSGTFGWTRRGGALRISTGELRLASAAGTGRTRLAVTIPDVGSPVVDLAGTAESPSARALLEYLPLQRFRPNVVEWLDRAIVSGRVPAVQVTWQGPLRAFPYDEGDGLFRAEVKLADAVIDYAPNWPRLEGVAATVVFDRASIASSENRGTVGGAPFQDADVQIANLRIDPLLSIAANEKLQVPQLVDFLRRTPVADAIGPTLDSVVGAGDAVADVKLAIPIKNARDFRLSGTIAADGATLGLRGVAFDLRELSGVVRVENTQLSAEGMKARFLGEPIDIALRPARADEPGLTHVVETRGTTPAPKFSAAFSLPFPDRVSGNIAWRATTLIPARKGKSALHILVKTDLAGLASTIPAPLQKAAGAVDPLDLDLSFPKAGTLDVEGRLRRGLTWNLRFASRAQGPLRLERGLIRSGAVRAILPGEPGVEIRGDFDTLRFEDWFPSSQGGKSAQAPPIREIELRARQFAIFGQLFRDVSLDAVRQGQTWTVNVRGPSARGQIRVPTAASDTAPLLLDMERLALTETAPGSGDDTADPRRLPPIKAKIADFVLGDMKFGRLEAEALQRGDGVVVEPLNLQSPNARIAGDATWLVEGGDPNRQRSQLRLRLQSSDIKATLIALGYDPVVEGRKASVDLDVVWSGGPSPDFLSIASGRVGIDLERGQFLAVDPGTGRLVGLLSVAALPRRLGLDFRDVVRDGLAFDRVKGEFRLDAGNAFTCNLGLEGPVADVGMVGRTGLSTRDYEQVAVVRPHVSDVVALGGAVVGGPVIGGAVLLVSQIFRKPLSSLGESYYEVKGSWTKPTVQKVQRSDVDVTPFRDCERYLAEVLKTLPPLPEGGLDTEGDASGAPSSTDAQTPPAR